MPARQKGLNRYFFIEYFLYLHFKCFLLSRSPLQKPPIPYLPSPASMRMLIHLPTHPLLSSLPGLHWSIEHPQAQRPLLPLMFNKATLATYAASTMSPFMCILWLVVQSLGALGVVVWPVDTVAPSMRLQAPSVPSVPSPTPPSGPLAQSNGWLQASTSVYVRLWQSLSGDSSNRLPSASTSWHPQ